MNKIFLTASAIGLILASGNVNAADSAESRIDKLEQEIQLLKQELKSQAAQNKKAFKSHEATAGSSKLVTPEAASDNANVTIGKKGLKIASPDKKYQLGVNGVFQFDNRSFIGDTSSTGRNDNIVRRARPTLTFKAGDATLLFTPDFAGTSSTANNTKTVDAYANYKFNGAAQLRVGKFKTPVGLEALQSDPDNFFTERGYAASLAPSREVGIQLSGEALSDRLEYQVGVFNGGIDGGSTDGDSDDKKDIAARIFAKPFHNSSVSSLQGFGAGVGGSLGEREGSTANRILPTYATLGQQQFFAYNNSTGNITYANGEQWRIQPQAYWYSGNKGILAEYAVSNQRVVNGTASAELQNTAWNVSASYVITGEDVKFKDSVKPANEFNPSEGGWGAWEVVARTTTLTIDSAAFPTFASIATSAKKAQSYSGGLNWYLNENLKIATNYNFTEFDGGAAGGKDRPEEHVIQSRLQIRF